MLKLRNIVNKVKGKDVGISNTLSYLFKKEYNQTPRKNIVSYLGDGKWMGKLSKQFGMFGDSAKVSDFESLSNVINPKTGDKVAKKSKGSKDYDFMELTFSAPKDFSILSFLDEELGFQTYNKMLATAYVKTMDYIESQAVSRVDSANNLISCPNILYAGFQHETSRPTSNPEDKSLVRPDPQLHIHTLLSKLVADNDGKVRTIRRHFLFNRQVEFGTLFRVNLANELRNVGYQIEPHEEISFEEKDGKVTKKKIKSFKIAGITNEQRLMFSKRKQAIEYLAKKYNITNTKGKDLIAQNFRNPKIKFDRNELISIWKEDAEIVGLNQALIKSIKKFDKDLMVKNARSDEDLIRDSVNFYNGKTYLTGKNIKQTLLEEAQFTPLNVDLKFQKLIEDGLIKKVGKYNYIATFNLKVGQIGEFRFNKLRHESPLEFVKSLKDYNCVTEKHKNFQYIETGFFCNSFIKDPTKIKDVKLISKTQFGSYLSKTIEGLYGNLEELNFKLRGKLKPDEIAKIQAQIKEIQLKIEMLEKERRNKPVVS